MRILFGGLGQKWEKRTAYRKAKKEWNNQFPLLSCHPAFASMEEIVQLEHLLREQKKLRLE